MTIDKTFDGSVLCTTHMEFDMKGKKLLSNRLDTTENILVIQVFNCVKVWTNEEC